MKIHVILFGLLMSTAVSGQGLTMMLNTSEVNGNTITYDVTAENFDEMLAMQYGIIYDQNKLKFVQFQGFGLPGMNELNFNPNVDGEIRALWFDANLEGITLAPGDVHYQIVFELLDTSPGDVCYSEDPLIIEFINTDIELTSFSVMDDCHGEPYEINLTVSGAQDLKESLGMQASSFIIGDAFAFTIDEPFEFGLTLYTSSGQLVHKVQKMHYPSGSQSIDVPPGLPSGLYFLAIEANGEVFAHRLVK